MLSSASASSIIILSTSSASCRLSTLRTDFPLKGLAFCFLSSLKALDLGKVSFGIQHVLEVGQAFVMKKLVSTSASCCSEGAHLQGIPSSRLCALSDDCAMKPPSQVRSSGFPCSPPGVDNVYGFKTQPCPHVRQLPSASLHQPPLLCSQTFSALSSAPLFFLMRVSRRSAKKAACRISFSSVAVSASPFVVSSCLNSSCLV